MEKDNRLSQHEVADESRLTTYNPLVSVITTTLNSIKYVEGCIQSVLNQSYPNIEHVLVDGGSSDGTVELLTSYRDRYPDRIRFISELDKNAPDAWNKGLKIAKGDIFGWIGADDTYESDAILTAIEFFRSNPDAYFVYGAFNIIDERGKITQIPRPKDFNLRRAINGTCAVITTSAFYKRKVVDEVGFMDTSINSCDYDFWIRVGMKFNIYRIDKILSNFRMAESSISARKGAMAMYAREGLILNRRYGGNIASGYIRYFRLMLMEWLNPAFGFAYPFLARILGR